MIEEDRTIKMAIMVIRWGMLELGERMYDNIDYNYIISTSI